MKATSFTLFITAIHFLFLFYFFAFVAHTPHVYVSTCNTWLNVCVLGLPVCSAAHCVCLKHTVFFFFFFKPLNQKREEKKIQWFAFRATGQYMVSSQPRPVVWLLDCLVECLLADSVTWRQPRCHSVRRFRHVLDVELFISRPAGALAKPQGGRFRLSHVMDRKDMFYFFLMLRICF